MARSTVRKKQISPAHFKGRKAAASPDNPEYIAKSDKSGELAPTSGTR